MDGLDVGETGLAEHQLPKVIEDLIEKGKYDNMQRKVVKVSFIKIKKSSRLSLMNLSFW